MAKGTLNIDDISVVTSFNEGYEGVILKKIKDLLLKYKNTLDSGEPSFDEFMDIYSTFDGVFYNMILIRYGIENLLID